MKRKNIIINPSKQLIERASRKGVRNAAKETMEIMGYNVIVRNGWLIKVFKDGSTQNLKRIYTNTSKVILD